MLADRYLLKRFIAAGGMGEVWEAEDALLRETVALKLLKGDSSAEAVARLKSEVTLARRITHRNVCRIHEFAAHRPKGEEPIFFFTMELLQGVTLSELLASRGPLPEAEVLEIVVQLAAGLDAAHRAGVIHRDFKSANVFVEPGDHPRVVITDFGIARAIEPGPRISEAPGALLGTPAYMAPEQVDGRDAVPASDLYALGIVTFELLTGRLPYDGATPLSQAMARLSRPPPDVSQFRGDLSVHWPEALHQIFSRRPEDRLQSGEAFVNALRDASFIDRPGLRVRVRAGLTTVLIATLTMAGFWWVFGADRRQWADVPTSTASSPESARALRDVMVAHSTIQGRPDALRNLVAADPEFVEARFQLLYLDAFASTNRPPDTNELLQQVLSRRARLTRRDQELLEAIEPSLLDPPRHDEALARLVELAERRPRDAQIWNAIGVEHTTAKRTHDAVLAFKAEREIDPGSLSGVANEAIDAYEQGNPAEAHRLIAQCLAKNPAHVACLTKAGDLASAEGDCGRLDELGRGLMTASPAFKPKALLYFRYSALLHGDADPAALEALRALMRQQLQPIWHDSIEEAAAIARHDLGAQLVALEADEPSVDDIAPTVDAAARARLLLELGRNDEALVAARQALAMTTTAPAPAHLHLDATPRLWMLQRQHGVLSKAEHVARREAWVASWRKRLGASAITQEALLWVIGWAPFDQGTAELGVEALEAWGRRPLPRDALALASVTHGLPFLVDLGQLLMSGASLVDAEQVLTQADAQCAWSLLGPRSGLLLAQVQARRGNGAAACETLKRHRQTWRDARPRSVSLERANELAAELGCH